MKRDPLAARCQRCGDYFQTGRRDAKYCTHACRQAAYAGRPLPDAERVCLNCDAPIGHKRADARFCCEACRSQFNRPLTPADREFIADALASGS